jgi:hypothetical protein
LFSTHSSIYYLLFTSFASKRFAAQTRLVSADGWSFLNFCYDDPSMRLTLDGSDEPSRYSIQLYQRAATQVDQAVKKVLEVSCGHGGGASFTRFASDVTDWAICRAVQNGEFSYGVYRFTKD